MIPTFIRWALYLKRDLIKTEAADHQSDDLNLVLLQPGLYAEQS